MFQSLSSAIVEDKAHVQCETSIFFIPTQYADKETFQLTCKI